MSRQISFSLDPYNTTRALLADPDHRKRVFQAIKDDSKSGPPAMTEKLGYSNLAEEGQDAQWATLFPATDREKKPGQVGLFYNAKKSGFPLFRLRPQPKKTQAADVSESPVAPSGGVDLSDVDIVALAKQLNISVEQATAAVTASLRPDTEPQDELEDDVKEILDRE